MPIRYVLAVVLTVLFFGIGFAGVEHAGEHRSEQKIEGQVGTIEDAALSLLETEQTPPRGLDGPRRVLGIELPTEGLVSTSVDTLVFERKTESNVTIVSYSVDGGGRRTSKINAPIENARDGREIVDVSDKRGSQRVILELVRSPDREPVVEMTIE